MKNAIIITIICIVILGTLGSFFSLLGYKIGLQNSINTENLYSINAEVIEINNDEIFIKDLRGEIWSFNSEGIDWEIGDEMTVIFDSKGTGDLTDDMVINVNWLGEWEG